MIARVMKICGLFAICLGVAGAMLLMGNQRFEPRYNRVPVVQDWSHRHMVYSHPKTIIQNLQVQQQARYAQQFLRRNFSPRSPIGGRPIPKPIRFHRPEMSNDLHRDWQVIMPSAGYTLGDAVFPAKYTFDVNAAPNCTNDFVVFTTSQGGVGVTDIYALNELYTGTCSGVPSTLWAYQVQSHTNGAAITSPILSLDGTQVAWVEGEGGTATLHILKPYAGAGTLGAPAAPTTVAASAFRSCTPNSTNLGCVTSVDFSNLADDTGGAGAITPSSPYYDYAYDAIFVGDDAGVLHLFMGVFDGTPAEVTGGSTGWPFTVNSGHPLTGPIFDDGSFHVFVGDSTGQLSYVAVAPGTLNASAGAIWTIAGATSITDPPIVDGTTGMVFVFARTTSGAEVGEADTATLGTHTGPVNVGTANTVPFHSGVFDNAYYSSDTGAGTGTGNLYVCGNNNGPNEPELYQIAVTSGTIGTATPEFTAATASEECSPVTEFYNPTTSADSIFFSVPASGNASTDCAGEGCVFAATLTPNGSAETVTVSGAMAASGGASGIVVDNDSAIAGGTNVYYSWLGNSSATYPCNSDTSGTGCTVQVAQLGLGSAGVVVQHTSGNSDASLSETAYLHTYSTPGDLILIFSHWDGAGITVTSVAGDYGLNTYTPLGPAIYIGTEGGYPNWIQAWYATNIQGSPDGFTVTYSAKTATISTVDVIEYSGLTTEDTSTYAINTGTGTALTTGPSGLTTAENETIVGMFGSSSLDYPFTPGPGYKGEVIDATSFIEDMGVATAGNSYTATATGLLSGAGWGGIVVGFRNAVQ